MLQKGDLLPSTWNDSENVVATTTATATTVKGPPGQCGDEQTPLMDEDGLWQQAGVVVDLAPLAVQA